MNIDTASSARAPTPPAKGSTAAAVARGQDDAAQHAAGDASFLSMLKAFAQSPSESSADALAAGLVPQDTGLDTQAVDVARDSVPVLALALPSNPPPADAASAANDASVLGRHAPGARGGGAHTMDGQEPLARSNALELAGADLSAVATDAADATDRKLGMAAQAADETAQQMVRAKAEVALEAGKHAEALGASKELDASRLRAVVTPPASASAAPVVSMFEAGLAGLRAGPGSRSSERGAQRHAISELAAGWGGWSDAVPAGGAHQTASTVYAPTASTPVPAAALAQKMHYWVAGGVQSAELQLDAFDGGTVEVRIAVKGDRAVVEFRCDQLQARQLLLEAMPQLKDLLADEGLVLSGGFVGGSAQQQGDDRSGRHARPTADVRTGSVQVRQVPAPMGAAVRSVPGAALDLFV